MSDRMRAGVKLATLVLALGSMALPGCNASPENAGTRVVAADRPSVVLPVTRPSQASAVRVATYNIENFRNVFRGRELSQNGPDRDDPLVRELIADRRTTDDRRSWMIATTIKDVDADVLMVQESAEQRQLEEFNRRFLGGKYALVQVFPTNSGRGQNLSMYLKPGFKVVDHLYLYEDKDPTADGKIEPVPPPATSSSSASTRGSGNRGGNELSDDTYADPDARGGRIFARGPAFVLIETPSGYRFWVGNTHQKSKSGNSVPVTQWRNREATRSMEAIKQLRDKGPRDVLLIGDFNDSLGTDKFEEQGGGDTIGRMATDPELVLITLPLAKDPANSTFGGYGRSTHHSVIDHGLATKELSAKVRQVQIYTGHLAPAASDHYPVVFDIVP